VLALGGLVVAPLRLCPVSLALTALAAVPPRVPLPGASHAVVGVVAMTMSAVVAGPRSVPLVIVMAGVVAVVTVHSSVVDDPEGRIPGAPCPPEAAAVLPIPDPIAVIAHPGRLMLMLSGSPPMGVGALKNTPVTGDMGDGVRIVVPVVHMPTM